MEKESVVLVDSNDTEIGTMEKMEAHRSGKLHRALSVFIFNTEGKWLLHKRAQTKYHSGGLWTNACCSHPRPKENINTAAVRRLEEEMGLSCELKFLFTFIYQAEVGDELIEHELDHVFIGTTDATPKVNSAEASDWSFFTTEEIAAHLKETPERFTKWFQLIFDRVNQSIGHR
jgi:isopentenyl-diphosphate delta-isomerase